MSSADGEHILDGRNLRARRDVGVVAEADAGSGAALDDHLVAVMHQLAHAAGDEADAVFVRLHLFRHADQHQAASFKTAPNVPNSSSIWPREMTSGGDSAMMSPVVRMRSPRS